MPGTNKAAAAGFSLIELLVVVFIIGIIATMLTLSVATTGGDEKRMLRAAERFAALLALAREDALFQARERGIRFYPDRYEFSLLDTGDIRDPDDDTWIVSTRDEGGGIDIPAEWQVVLEIEGRPVALERSAMDVETRYTPQLFIFSSGEFSDAFSVTLRQRRGDYSVRVDVGPDGEAGIIADGR